MILSEVTGIPSGALPVAALRDHLRMGSGFSDDAVQDGLLERLLRAALAAIEGRTGKALIARDFRLEVAAWAGCAQVLPVAPVSAILSVALRDRTGAATAVDALAYGLERDAHRPVLAGAGGALPPVPAGGRAEVVFTAGFGPAWGDVPADLAQAVLLLAAHYHEQRHAAGPSDAPIPYGIGALVERWRILRVTAGRPAGRAR